MSGTSQLGSRVLDLLSASAPTVLSVGNTSNSGNILLYDANLPANGYLIQSSNLLFSIKGNTGVANTFVGIGTTVPTSTLHVQGNTLVSGTLTSSNLNIIGTTTIINSTIINTSNMSINNTGTGPALSVTQQQNTAQPVAQFISGSTNAMYINNLGNVGIGTTNPTSNLHVIGNALVTGTVSRQIPILSMAQNSNLGTTIPNNNLVPLYYNFVNSSNSVNYSNYIGIGTYGVGTLFTNISGQQLTCAVSYTTTFLTAATNNVLYYCWINVFYPGQEIRYGHCQINQNGPLGAGNSFTHIAGSATIVLPINASFVIYGYVYNNAVPVTTYASARYGDSTSIQIGIL